ncbi:MAG: sulfatase-like hydrolase/transferase [Pseudomonadota bacterium]
MSSHQPSEIPPPAPIFGYGHYPLAATPFLVIFLIMPCELFFNQADEWDLELGQLVMLPLTGMLGFLATCLFLSLLARKYRWLAAGIAAGLFVLGCYLLLADLYAPVQMAAMEGAALASDEPLKYTLLEMAIAVLALGGLFVLLRGKGARVAIAFSTLLALVSFGYGGVVLANLTHAEPDLTKAPAVAETGAGNVYHIVLDRMQTDAFLDAVDRLDLRSSFEGFDLFSNNVANYLTTHPSRASYLSGTFYHVGKFKDWHTEIWREQGIQKLLSDQGYRIWNYVPFRQWRDRDVDIFKYSIDLYEEKNGIAGSGFADFVTLWLLRLAPNALTNEAIAPIESVRDRLVALLDRSATGGFTRSDQPAEYGRPEDDVRSAGDVRLTIEQGIQVVASKQMVEQMVADEASRGDAGNYVYLHAVMPHHPYVFKEDCLYWDVLATALDAAGRRQAYLDQSACSVRLIKAFLDRLHDLGRYDDATILIHADTGAEEGFMADPPDYRISGSTLGWANGTILSGASALLMIKRPGGRGPLREREQVTQLVDLFPTLVDILDMEDMTAAAVHGRSVYAGHPAQSDVRISFDPEERWGDDYIDVRIDTPDDLARSKLTVVGPTLEPDHWREAIRNAKP